MQDLRLEALQIFVKRLVVALLLFIKEYDSPRLDV